MPPSAVPRRPRQRQDMLWLTRFGRLRRPRWLRRPQWCERYRTDNAAAVAAFTAGIHAAMWPLVTLLIDHWAVRGRSPWELYPLQGSSTLAMVGMSPLGIPFGTIAIALGYVGLRRVYAGKVTGGRKRAFAGVVLGAVGVAGGLLWVVLALASSQA